MGEQNLEVLVQALRLIKQISLKISKASDLSWQVSLDFPEQIPESQQRSISATNASALLLEANGTNSQKNPITSANINSAGQSSATSEIPLESESSDSSDSDSLEQQSHPDSTTSSQSNPITPSPDKYSQEQSSETEYLQYKSLISCLKNSFSEDDLKDLCQLFIDFKWKDPSSYKRITSEKNNHQTMIRELINYVRIHDCVKEFIEHITKERPELKKKLDYERLIMFHNKDIQEDKKKSR